ncbi:MAG: glucose-1-phosphate thymidylyltransferase RfbA [Candidatus Heimdallarchaeota archaeon]|nr:glucose-1-phosphate thymidylyltransferase RfbA [Candidatus Heimdallarchaeota archaeon]
MKGIILAGGHGTRLNPLTLAISKQLLPVYDKPMIYYPLSMLMLADIREILVISDPINLPLFERLLGNGKQWGMDISFIEQKEPRGLAEAFLLGKSFINRDPTCLILGDNIFFGHSLPKQLRNAAELTSGAKIFAYEVMKPQQYGVVEFDNQKKAISLEEKPSEPKSNFAIPGLYFYDDKVCDYAEMLDYSDRGELEITDLNRLYLERDELSVEVFGRGVAWLDAGNPDALLQASQFVQAIEERQGMMISCIEEISYRREFISLEELMALVNAMGNNRYKEYLERLIVTEKNSI